MNSPFWKQEIVSPSGILSIRSSLKRLGFPGRSARPPSRPLSAIALASSRVIALYSNFWFSFAIFFISASIFSKSSGVIRCFRSKS